MKYNRILLKLSGEALAGASGKGLNEEVMGSFARQIAGVVKAGTQVAATFSAVCRVWGQDLSVFAATIWVCWPPSSTP